MKAVLSRKYENSLTRGRLVVFDGEKVRLQILTLELPWNGNQRRVSCIPEGRYEVHKIYSPKFGNCFHLQDVPDRDGILIHKGNYASLLSDYPNDTSGCILPGMAFEDINSDGQVDIIQSTHALKSLLNIMPNEFMLHII